MSETSGSRVRRIIVHRLVSAGIDKVALWTFGWFVTWTLYIFVRLLVPSVFLSSPFAVAVFGIGLYLGLTSLSFLRRNAAHGKNPGRIVQLILWSYAIFAFGLLALAIGTVLWAVNTFGK